MVKNARKKVQFNLKIFSNNNADNCDSIAQCTMVYFDMQKNN